MTGPTNRTPTCVVCGEVIDESAGGVPVWLDAEMAEELGEHDGEAYHLNRCEDGVFDEVHAEVKS